MTNRVGEADVTALNQENAATANTDKHKHIRHAQRRDRLTTLALAIFAGVLVEIAVQSGWISDLLVAAPSAVWDALEASVRSGLLLTHAASTMTAALVALGIATVSGILVAGLLISSQRLERVLLPFVVAFQSMPKIAIAPLIVLWVGYGSSGKIIISTIVCFFPIMLNTLHGLRIREIEHLELMQSLGASKLEMFRYIRLPGAVPFIFAGLHIGAVFALLGVVVGEFTGAQDGLGYFLLQQKAAFNVPGIFAILVVLMVLGVSIQAAMSGLERRISFWGRDQTHHERV